MHTRRKRFVIAVVVVALIYVITPFVAGLVGTYDRRGPKVFAEDHHEILYRVGYSLFHYDKPRVPYKQERSWFYGIQGEPILEQQIRDKRE